jgi:hypothetical protein
MKTLSKSQYTRGLQCAKSLWLYREKPSLRDAVTPDQQTIFDQGTAVGILAQKWIKGGTLITNDHNDPEGAILATAKAIEAGWKVIYEAAFLYDGVLVRADIIAQNIEKAWDLYEVKSTTDVEDTHLNDVAIQRYVITGAGIPLTRSHIVHLDPGYVRLGALDLQNLFKSVDVTEETKDDLAQVPSNLAAMKIVADAAEAPAIGIGDHCLKPHECDFKGTCWAHVPKYSVFNIPYAKMEKKLDLFNRGVHRVDQVNPALAGLTDKRSIRAVEVARLENPMIDKKAIAVFLNGLSYPLTHLDFETENPAIPPYDGLRPYSQMPFQASLRVQQERGGPVVEHGFLGDGLTDPRHGVTDFLLRNIPASGTILAYFKPFEAGRIKELAQEPSARPLLNAMDRLQDLADPFSKGWYAHKGFLGKWSIKNVLPVLVPTMSYENLVIKNGREAMAAYAELRDPKLDPARRAMLRESLQVYCGQDTLGMVRIIDFLYAIAS